MFGVFEAFFRCDLDLTNNIGEGDVGAQVVAYEEGFYVVRVEGLGDEVVT